VFPSDGWMFCAWCMPCSLLMRGSRRFPPFFFLPAPCTVQRAGRLHCSHHASVFTTTDSFNREYVTPVRAPATAGAEAVLLPSPAEVNSREAAAALAAEVGGGDVEGVHRRISLAARLLLEWGHAQHFFGKVRWFPSHAPPSPLPPRLPCPAPVSLFPCVRTVLQVWIRWCAGSLVTATHFLGQRAVCCSLLWLQ
jgi:hypothetical protein